MERTRTLAFQTDVSREFHVTLTSMPCISALQGIPNAPFMPCHAMPHQKFP